jgi:hypothetical protein
MTNDLNKFTPDPRLDALLDEALSPESVEGGLPAGLSDRIFAATSASLAPSRTRSGVLARIGFPTLSAIAAAILLLVGGAVWLSTRDADTAPPGGSFAHQDQPFTPEDINKVNKDLAQIAAHDGPHEPVDDEIDLLAVELEQFAENSGWNVPDDVYGEELGDVYLDPSDSLF